MLSTARSDGKVALKILQESPLDQESGQRDDADVAAQVEHWIPSRYNIRATAEDGSLVLWNTLSGAMSVFKPEQASPILSLLKKKGFETPKEGVAGYLADRGFLIPKGVDEYRKFQLKFGQQHYRTDRLELFVLSSEDCNFRCKYCYEDFARGTMRPEVREGIKRLVERRIEHLRVLQVSWFGGEPLYGWAAIEDLAPYCLEMAQEHGVAYGSQMTTNGYLMTPDVADKLLAWKISNFQITVDGVPEDHDCNRPTRDGRGTFWTIFDNLKAMARRTEQFDINLRVNFDKTNQGRMGEFLEMVEKEFRDDPRFRISFHAVGRWGGDNDEELEVCGADEQRQVVEEMKAEAYRRGLRFSTLRDVSRMGSHVCYAARPYNFIIGASGKVMKCTIALDTDERNVVGHITNDGDLMLKDDRMSMWTEPAFERDQQCQKCVVLPSCQGISCPLPRIWQDERPCVTTRTTAKAQLVEALKYPSRSVRTREVSGGSQPSGTKQ